MYDEVLYQICLRTLYELFAGPSQVDMIKSIVFNGWVDAVDKATGANTHPCVTDLSKLPRVSFWL